MWFSRSYFNVSSSFKLIFPDKKNILKYTTVSGVKGFDGSKIKTDNSIIKSID